MSPQVQIESIQSQPKIPKWSLAARIAFRFCPVSYTHLVNTALYASLGSTTNLNLPPAVVAAANDLSGLLDAISYVFLHSSMSSALAQAATSAANAQSTPLAKVQAALYIVLTSSEYQVVQ